MSFPTHAEAKQIVAKYGEKAILNLARKGKRDPDSVTEEEIRAVSAYVWLREMSKRN